MNDLSFASTGNRLPPQNIEAEEAVLGGILLDPDAYMRVAEILMPEMFYISAHRHIYQAAQRLNLRSQPTDLLAVTSWLSDNDLLTRVGGRNKLASLVDRTVSAVNIDALAILVKDKYIRRRMIKAGNEIVHLGYATDRELSDVVTSAELGLFEVSKGAVAGDDCTAAADILVDFFNDVEMRHLGLIPPGIPTGWYDLDAILCGGLQRDQYYIVAGRPAMGKTGLGVGAAYNIVSMTGMPAVIFSLEMSKKQLISRLVSMTARIEGIFLQSGRIYNSQWDKLSKAIGIISEMPIFISDSTSRIDFLTMRSNLRKLQAQHGQLGVVVVDYLQLLEDKAPGQTQAQRLGYVSRQLASMSKEFNVPVIALAQLNRDVDDRQNKRPMMSDIKGSGDIEQDADVILTLYRDEYYSPDTTERGIAEVGIIKNRHGATGTVKLLFDPQFTEFKNLARDFNDNPPRTPRLRAL
jgi:replicative DNA helicase